MANGNHDPDDVRSRMHDAVYGMLIDRIRRDRYPSSSMMNMVEAGMSDRERREYVGALLEKVTDDQFPSMDMLKRLIALV
ncbi:MAG: hypothetical protein QOC66_1793 [Pseudonocardiales bacterium]|jgi:hypothetical protein|nr:hypothetical protein [Pseudonocardiales bacterium]